MATFPKAPNFRAVFAHIADESGTKPRHDFVPAGLLYLVGGVQQFGYAARRRGQSSRVSALSTPLRAAFQASGGNYGGILVIDGVHGMP